jgi:hypothetical protein
MPGKNQPAGVLSRLSQRVSPTRIQDRIQRISSFHPIVLHLINTYAETNKCQLPTTLRVSPPVTPPASPPPHPAQRARVTMDKVEGEATRGNTVPHKNKKQTILRSRAFCLDLVGIRDNRPNLLKAREAEALQASRAISKERAYATPTRTVENSPILQNRFELAFTQPKENRPEKRKRKKDTKCTRTAQTLQNSAAQTLHEPIPRQGLQGRQAHHDTTSAHQQGHQARQCCLRSRTAATFPNGGKGLQAQRGATNIPIKAEAARHERSSFEGEQH